NQLNPGGSGQAYRLIGVTFRLEQTAALQLDSGRGLRDVPLRRLITGQILDQKPPLVSGDFRVAAFGWTNDAAKIFWRIEQSTPLPFNLLSATIDIKVND